MSLFENSEYRWRETFLVLFDDQHRPSTETFRQAMARLGDRYEVDLLIENDTSQVE